jgi:hypothetical protein
MREWAGQTKNNRSILITRPKRLEARSAPGVTAALGWRDRCLKINVQRRLVDGEITRFCADTHSLVRRCFAARLFAKIGQSTGRDGGSRVPRPAPSNPIVRRFEIDSGIVGTQDTGHE